MSTLGQKQTYAPQQTMSALPAIASAKADFRTRSCLLYPRKRTCAVQGVMSAKGQERTSRLLDHRIGCGEQRLRNGVNHSFGFVATRWTQRHKFSVNAEV